MVGVVVVILAVVLGVFMATGNDDKGNNNVTDTTNSLGLSDEIVSSFNKYANYLFVGEDSDEKFVPIENWILASALKNAVFNSDIEWKEKYFANARRLQSSLVDLVGEAYSEESEDGESAMSQFLLIIDRMPAEFEALESLAYVSVDSGNHLELAERNANLKNAMLAVLNACVQVNDLMGGENDA